MSGNVQVAIQELLKDDLQKFIDKQTEQAQKIEELEKTLQDLSSKLGEREQEAAQLREGFTTFQKELEESNAKAQALMNEDIAALKARADRFEDDSEGVGGLKQVFERLQSIEKIVGPNTGDLGARVDEASRLSKETRTRADEHDRHLRELSRQVDDALAKLAVNSNRVDSAEKTVASNSEAQKALEDSVSRKYERLWEDVLRAIEEMKGDQLEVLRRELQERYDSSRSETKSMVKYALDFMASAHGDRRQMAINKNLILAWKEQTWISARRRMGLASLHKLTMSRQRSVFNRFVVTTVTEAKTSQLCDRLRRQYDEQLSQLAKKTEDGENTLSWSVQGLSEQVSTLRHEKCSTEDLTKVRSEMREELKAIGTLNVKLNEHGQILTNNAEEHRAHREAESTLGKQLAETSSGLQDLTELSSTLAKNEDVNNMIRDILMIWNSLKSIDATKADREYVENFAILSRDKDKLSSRRLEDLEADLAAKSRQDVLRVQEKMSEVDTRIDESVKNMRHWEQMWEKLSGLVEDLVTKINDLQAHAADHGQLHDTYRPVHRMGSRKSLSRAEIPTLPATTRASSEGPGHYISNDAVTPKSYNSVNPQVPTDALDSKMLWISGAKGIVDATIDQAIHSATPSPAGLLSARKIARPKSATKTRQHDRGLLNAVAR